MKNPKHEIRLILKELQGAKRLVCNTKQTPNSNIPNSKQFDLEEGCFRFGKRVRGFLKKIPRTISNIEDGKQLAKSSGSLGANYIEANEALSKKDFKMRIKISKKESKETRWWLKLIDVGNDQELKEEQRELIQEATELMNILGSILAKSK